MKVKQQVNFHNRFDIEVRDKDTGELKQKGIAENIILDRAYTRLCNFSSYFSYIHFGKGTGTLSSSRTTLFSSLGYKSAIDEEKVKAYPTSKVTRKITLNSEEFVGQTISEVGISESTSAINTHALIKDSEGNPLSITKTALDIVIIYATVFIELVNPSENFVFSSMPSDNLLINYLVDNASITSKIVVGSNGKASSIYSKPINWLIQNTATTTVDTMNKKVINSTRFSISQGNDYKKISELSLLDICRICLPEASVFSSYQLNGVNVGVGDGIVSEFLVPYSNPSSWKYYIDGVETIDFMYEPDILPTEMYRWIELSTDKDLDFLYKAPFIYGENYQTGFEFLPTTYPYQFIFPINTSLNGLTLCVKGYLGNESSYLDVKIEGSINKENWLELAYVSKSGLGNLLLNKAITNTTVYQWIRVTITGNSNYSNKLYDFGIVPPSDTNKVKFTTPPANNQVITADLTVPYIPKTEDYVLDVTFELQFGEGV